MKKKLAEQLGNNFGIELDKREIYVLKPKISTKSRGIRPSQNLNVGKVFKPYGTLSRNLKKMQ